jgi:hypothetical protein
MGAHSVHGFAHRQDHNGMFESICRCCFRSVGMTKTVAALTALELGHQCREQDVNRVSRIKKGDGKWSGRPR